MFWAIFETASLRSGSGSPGVFTYKRFGGGFNFLRPDAVSLYRQP